MISVILCGGVGARLWPVSREWHPKPFIRLSDGKSFIQKTFVRGASAPGCESFLVITNRELYFKVAEEFTGVDLPVRLSVILEPFGRNTGPAIAAAALCVKKTYGENAPILILPSDHLIANQDKFFEIVTRAQELANNGKLVTFGIMPTKPETGFGYIEADGEKVVRFVEKPTREKAQEYIESGRYVWNSGIFLFRAGDMLREMEEHCPELLLAVSSCLEASTVNVDGTAFELELDAKTFTEVPDISIDYAVFEKSRNVAVVKGDDIGWNDIGSWLELCGLQDPDENGNRVANARNAVLHDTVKCDINNSKRLVATIGLENILIVDTDDALLVADKSRAQDVKHIYNHLKKVGNQTHKHHRTVYRPWGSFTLLEQGNRYKTKCLVLKPGASISLQLHHHRSEHWIVVSGMAEVTCAEEVFFVNTNESTYIKAGSRHRVTNPGKVELVLIEVQSGDYLGEDDIVRFSDIYGRAENEG